ncbi:16550_t:CDS:2, partial [Cetraspora pellucida]
KKAPNIKFINKNYPNIELKMKKFDINLMQFYIVDDNNYPLENVPKNIKCFVCSRFKKLEKEVKKIDGMEKVKIKLLEYNIENNESSEETKFEIIE